MPPWAVNNRSAFDHFATHVLHNYSGYEWDTWSRANRRLLIASQVGEAPEAGSWWFPHEVHAAAGGRLYQTALATLTLEIYYRYLPLYRVADGQDKVPVDPTELSTETLTAPPADQAAQEEEYNDADNAFEHKGGGELGGAGGFNTTAWGKGAKVTGQGGVGGGFGGRGSGHRAGELGRSDGNEGASAMAMLAYLGAGKGPGAGSVPPYVATWKPSTLVPNTSRLMVGEKEELPLRGMQVDVRIDGFRGCVLLDLYYYNDRPQQFEGSFQLRLPKEASPYFFAFGQTVYQAPTIGADRRSSSNPRRFARPTRPPSRFWPCGAGVGSSPRRPTSCPGKRPPWPIATRSAAA